jgi:predicted choloylglycine hydrolase
MGEKLTVKVVDLQGEYVQFGRTQGNEMKQSPLLLQMKKLAALNRNPNTAKGKALLKKFSPNLLEEIAGLGEVLQLDRTDALQFSGYDVVFPKMGCTTLVTEGAYIRNYDFSPLLYDARLVFTNPANGYATVGFSQLVTGRLDGMNEKGLVAGLHFVNNEERAEGFFATSIVRMLLEQCANTDEAVRLITAIPHGYCYNYSITDRDGNSVRIEAAPDRQIITSAEPLICTNHFESDALKDKNRNHLQVQSSLARKQYIRSLLEKNLTVPDLFKAFNHRESPLFAEHYKEYFGTLHTVVYLPEELKVLVGVGGNQEQTEFSLGDYMKNKQTLPCCLTGEIRW